MNEEKIEEIKNSIKQLMEFISAQTEEPPQEIVELLEQVMNHAAKRIAELRQQSPSAPNVPQLDPGPFPSSNVNSFKYDPKNQKLFVKFHGKDNPSSGPTYQYSNIPGFIYDVFSKGAIGPKTSGQNRYHRWIKNVTPSLGGTLNALIKAGNFPYQKVS